MGTPGEGYGGKGADFNRVARQLQEQKNGTEAEVPFGDTGIKVKRIEMSATETGDAALKAKREKIAALKEKEQADKQAARQEAAALKEKEQADKQAAHQEAAKVLEDNYLLLAAEQLAKEAGSRLEENYVLMAQEAKKEGEKSQKSVASVTAKKAKQAQLQPLEKKVAAEPPEDLAAWLANDANTAAFGEAKDTALTLHALSQPFLRASPLALLAHYLNKSHHKGDLNKVLLFDVRRCVSEDNAWTKDRSGTAQYGYNYNWELHRQSFDPDHCWCTGRKIVESSRNLAVVGMGEGNIIQMEPATVRGVFLSAGGTLLVFPALQSMRLHFAGGKMVVDEKGWSVAKENPTMSIVVNFRDDTNEVESHTRAFIEEAEDSGHLGDDTFARLLGEKPVFSPERTGASHNTLAIDLIPTGCRKNNDKSLQRFSGDTERDVAMRLVIELATKHHLIISRFLILLYPRGFGTVHSDSLFKSYNTQYKVLVKYGGGEFVIQSEDGFFYVISLKKTTATGPASDILKSYTIKGSEDEKGDATASIAAAAPAAVTPAAATSAAASAGALSEVKVRVRVGGSVLGKKNLNAWTYQELQPMMATEEEEQGGEKKGEKKKGEKKKGRGKGKNTLAREKAELERKGEEREAKKLKKSQESV
ncbi:hypothetical protein TrCOL_g9273 [Triparma columacea]|uniref:Uncharacterized protein n=1 Tax=Triparma columacea TaxID=722753 RepID=A0A9W7G1T7_9STRA|nr:hypothetical protein TrCOL_g9273 [Triparma columacea]